MFQLLIAAILAISFAASEGNVKEDRVEAKYIGGGYGYQQDNPIGDSGSSYGHANRFDHGGDRRFGGGYEHRRQGHLTPVKIPYIDRNGCRFAGDVVCDVTSGTTRECKYFKCLLADENKNLWKKPTLRLSATNDSCGAKIGVLTEFCNANKLVLQAVGLIKNKHRPTPNHQPLIIKQRNPCILFRDVCT